jgi:probable O-glycosylation ligase (exosortase A-associated)
MWWVRLGLAGAMFLTAVAILGTHSRGALIGLVAMTTVLVVKGRRGRLLVAALILVLLPLTLELMPQKWFERMNTVRTYEEDASAMGRINAWKFAFNLAKARPLVGGGFEVFRPRFFSRYAPNPEDVHDAHSIYFEILGEQGFIGMALFLTLALLAWRSCSKMAREAERRDGPAWVPELARMMQVSLFGYGAAGAFVGLAYFDLYYNLIAIVVAAKLLANEEQLAAPEPEYEPALRVPAAATR